MSFWENFRAYNCQFCLRMLICFSRDDMFIFTMPALKKTVFKILASIWFWTPMSGTGWEIHNHFSLIVECKLIISCSSQKSSNVQYWQREYISIPHHISLFPPSFPLSLSLSAFLTVCVIVKDLCFTLIRMSNLWSGNKFLKFYLGKNSIYNDVKLDLFLKKIIWTSQKKKNLKTLYSLFFYLVQLVVIKIHQQTSFDDL